MSLNVGVGGNYSPWSPQEASMRRGVSIDRLRRFRQRSVESLSTAIVYLDAETIADLEAAGADVGLQPLEGGRLTVRPFPTTATMNMTTETDILRIVPWPRVYADLRSVGVRGEEAAEHLREVMHAR